MMRVSFLTCCLVALSFSGVLGAQERVEAPLVDKQVLPEYPADFKSFVVDNARVQLIVDPHGVPFSVISAPGLPDNVVQALSKWRFHSDRGSAAAAGRSVTIRIPIRRTIGEAIEGVGRFWHPSRRAVDGAFASAKDLDDARAATLEQDLASVPAAAPEALNGRLSLLAYATSSAAPDSVQMRLRQLLWLAKNMPTAQILGAPLCVPHPPAPAETSLFEEIRQAWLAQLAASPKDPPIVDHATNFLRFSDPEVAEKAAQLALEETDRAAVFLGDLYAIAALGVTAVDPRTGYPSAAGEQLPATPFAQKARTALAKTEDVRLLFAALSVVSEAGPALAKTGHVPAGYLEFCQDLLARATTFYPETRLQCGTSPAPSAAPQRLSVGGNVEQALQVKHAPPSYPPEARSRGITGTVTFRAVIGKDGVIQDLELLRGPFALYKSARDAVSHWTYKPTLLEGNPAEVLTHIDVKYTLNAR
jgi:TonB family protein